MSSEKSEERVGSALRADSGRPERGPTITPPAMDVSRNTVDTDWHTFDVVVMGEGTDEAG